MATLPYEEPGIHSPPQSVAAPFDWKPLFPYEPTITSQGAKKYNERYDARRIPIFNEREIPCDTWLSQLNVKVDAIGEDAVCPLIGQTAFPQGSQLYRWFNNLSASDLMLLSLGPNGWHNWQYAIYKMRDRLQPLIRHQAEARTKKTDESYHSYITSRYPLLKAAMPYAPENEIISKIKEAFTEDLAFSIMNEEADIQKLEARALRYERVTEIRQRHHTVLPSSYLHLETPTASGPNPESSSLMLTGTQSIRSYVRDGPKAAVIFLNRNCAVCERKNLQPRDHFNFEHNLYHDDLAESKTNAYWASLPQQFQESDSDESDPDF